MKKIIITGVAALAVAGGGYAATSSVASPGAPACDAWDDRESNRGLPGINRLVTTSDAAVVGTVVHVSAPRWNSADGAKWCPPVFGGTPPLLYRDVTVRVRRAVFDSTDVRAERGSDVTFRVFGDGTATGHVAMRNIDGSTIYENQADGHYAGGSDVLVLLARVDNFPSERGTEVVNQVVGSWLGSWTVKGASATSVQTERTVPVAELLARLVTERRLGRVPARDATTGRNPLS